MINVHTMGGKVDRVRRRLVLLALNEAHPQHFVYHRHFASQHQCDWGENMQVHFMIYPLVRDIRVTAMAAEVNL